MPRTVLILGGSGLLGAPVARRFRAEGYAVRLLVRDEARARRLLGDGFQHVVGGMGSADALSAAVDGCTAVHISLGGLSDPAEIDRVERRGTAEVAGSLQPPESPGSHCVRRVRRGSNRRSPSRRAREARRGTSHRRQRRSIHHLPANVLACWQPATSPSSWCAPSRHPKRRARGSTSRDPSRSRCGRRSASTARRWHRRLG